MHDLRMIRDEAEGLRDGMRRRGKLEVYGPVIDEAVALDRTRRQTIQAVEEQKAKRNAITQVVGKKKKAGEDASVEMAEARELGEAIAALEATLAPTEARLEALLLGVPNVPLPD
ncbi:MAG: serine--tRNA ligase, partial [Gemmatimonadaceae bacterium]